MMNYFATIEEHFAGRAGLCEYHWLGSTFEAVHRETLVAQYCPIDEVLIAQE